MELIAAIVAAAMGWKFGTFGAREVKAIAIVVLGWTTVTTLASLPYVDVVGLLVLLAFRVMLIALPYGAGVLVNRLQRRRRR